MKTLTSHGMTFEIVKKSKWTVEAHANGEKCASAPSVPKLQEKLDAMYAPKVVEQKAEKPAKAKKEKPAKAKKEKPAKAKKEKTVQKPKKGQLSIKAATIDLIVQGADDEDIIKTIQSKFPKSAFKQSHVSWYRSTLFRDGMITAEFAPRQSRAYKAWAKSTQTSDK